MKNFSQVIVFACLIWKIKLLYYNISLKSFANGKFWKSVTVRMIYYILWFSEDLLFSVSKWGNFLGFFSVSWICGYQLIGILIHTDFKAQE